MAARRASQALLPLALAGFTSAALLVGAAGSRAQGVFPIASCKEYTARAMSQIDMAFGCTGLTGPRWTPNSTDHTNWCTRATPTDRANEDAARRNALARSCTGRCGVVEIKDCEVYAARAMSQSDLQVTKACGYTGPRWSRNFAEHLNWCRGKDHIWLVSEDYQRRAELADCKSEPKRAWNACPGEPVFVISSPPPPPPPPPNPGLPNIAMSAPGGNSFVLTGSGFTPKTDVLIRVVNAQAQQIYVTTHGGIPFAADAAGKINFTLNGLCVLRGAIWFSVTDGRKVPSSVDITGNLWSNTVQMLCV